jgi:hypothetical protein
MPVNVAASFTNDHPYCDMNLVTILATAIISILLAFIGVALCLRPIRPAKGPMTSGHNTLVPVKRTERESQPTRLTPPGVGLFLSRLINARLMGKSPHPKRQGT